MNNDTSQAASPSVQERLPASGDFRRCNGGGHDLKVISSSYGGAPGVETVVRWCANCGGVVIDTDVDGRTQPGAVMLMRFPRAVGGRG